MKIFSLIIMSIFLVNGCDGQKKKELGNTIIEYTANTRGFYQKITIQNQMVTVTNDRDGNDKPTNKKIAESDWNVLISEFNELDLKELPNFKAPTEKRFYDGAAIAELTITYKDSIYKSNSFDHEYPPVEIEKLVNTIYTIAK